MRIRFSKLPAIALLAGLLAGCANYHLGSPGQPVVDTVFVPEATNTAFAPQAARLVTEAVRLEIARDGRISLAKGSSEAAGRLEIHLTRFDRSAKAPRADDTALTRKYAQTLTAEITLLDHNGKVLIDHQQVAVTRDVFTDSGQQPAEYQNMPVLAQALATEIAHRLLDRW